MSRAVAPPPHTHRALNAVTPCVFGSLLPVAAVCESLPSPPPDVEIDSCVGPGSDGATDLDAPYPNGTVCTVTCTGGKVPSEELQCVGANMWSSVTCVGESVDLSHGLLACCSPYGLLPPPPLRFNAWRRICYQNRQTCRGLVEHAVYRLGVVVAIEAAPNTHARTQRTDSIHHPPIRMGLKLVGLTDCYGKTPCRVQAAAFSHKPKGITAFCAVPTP